MAKDRLDYRDLMIMSIGNPFNIEQVCKKLNCSRVTATNRVRRLIELKYLVRSDEWGMYYKKD